MPSINDPNNDKSRLESRLEDVEDLPQQDKKLVNYWVSNFGDSNAESTTHIHLGHLLTLQKELDVRLAEADKYDWSSAVSTLAQDRDWQAGTKRNYQKSIRSFLEVVNDDDSEDDLNAKKSQISLTTDDSGGKINEDDVLSIDEVRLLITEASNRARDRAMFATLIDLGFRIAAVCALRVKDFSYEDGDSVAEISLNDEALGQKGSEGRTQVATFSAGYIRSYLRNEHPRPADENAPLFHKIGQHWDRDDPDDDGSISPAIFRKRMKRLAADYDIDEEKLHPHNMKHAAVTVWARRGMTDREIEHRAGWARDSGQLSRYEHLTGPDINKQILDTLGVDSASTDDSAEIAPIENCPNCSISVDAGMRFCPQCGQKIDIESWPDWFEDYIDEYGEEDALAEHLLENPSQITSKPANLDDSLRSQHRDKLEFVIGHSLSTLPTPADSETVPYSFERMDGSDETQVSVPFGVLSQYGDELRVRRTEEGLLTLVDIHGEDVATVDPIQLNSNN